MSEILNKLNFEYRLNEKGNTSLIVFLPAAVKADYYPHFPRISWNERLPNYDTLYLSDPFKKTPEWKDIHGSWFISPEGKSHLPRVAKIIEEFINQKKYTKVVFHGSSMGGYIAIVLGSLIKQTAVLSECPQIYLEEYMPTLKVFDKHFSDESRKLLPDIEKILIKNRGGSRFNIYTNAFDGQAKRHMQPLFNALKKNENIGVIKYLSINYIFTNMYDNVHTGMKFHDILPTINMIFSTAPIRKYNV